MITRFALWAERNHMALIYAAGAYGNSDTGWFGAYIPSKSLGTKYIGPVDADYVLEDSAGLKINKTELISSGYLNKPTVQIARPTNTSVLYCIKYK